MTVATKRASTVWDCFDWRGRRFVRTTLRDLHGPDVAFSIAQPLAGRYQIEELFVVGESSLLLWARDLRTGRPVAIKTLRTDGMCDRLAARSSTPSPEALERLITEVRRSRHVLQTERRLLVRLRNAGCNGIPHPNDYVYDHNPALSELPLEPYLTENQPYLVLQRLEGVSLEEVLEVDYPEGMDEHQALRWMWPLVKVLEILHEPWRMSSGRTWHCVYQDLKPANIVIDPWGRPSLLDFGGCQVVVDGVPVLEGAFTHGYSPPECEGPVARVLLPCADVYTIGTTLYHMLTGVDPRARLKRWRGQPGGHVKAGDLSSRVSSGVCRLLERCLAPRPSERLADARQVAGMISELIPT